MVRSIKRATSFAVRTSLRAGVGLRRLSVERMRGVLVAGVVSLGALGCGGTVYAIQVNAASNRLAEAKELGADRLAPYEYFLAKEYLDKAMSEASEADYSDAINFAEVSEENADKAIRLSRDAHRGAGR
jgi:hypothetical protein